MWPGKSRLEYCLDSALKSFSPRPVPPRAGSNVGRAAVVIVSSQWVCNHFYMNVQTVLTVIVNVLMLNWMWKTSFLITLLRCKIANFSQLDWTNKNTKHMDSRWPTVKCQNKLLSLNCRGSCVREEWVELYGLHFHARNLKIHYICKLVWFFYVWIFVLMFYFLFIRKIDVKRWKFALALITNKVSYFRNSFYKSTLFLWHLNRVEFGI